MKFIYLIQTNKDELEYKLPESSDKIVLYWGDEFKPGPDKIHYPNSTWMSGRNKLFAEALIKGNYDYFIFLDDDISFSYTANGERLNKLRKSIIKKIKKLRLSLAKTDITDFLRITYGKKINWFSSLEKNLEKFRPKVATCTELWHPWDANRNKDEVEKVTYGDHAVIAFHQSVAFDLLPYKSDGLVKESWYHAAEDMHERIVENCCHSTVRFNKLIYFNDLSRAYPKSTENWFLPKNSPKITNLEELHTLNPEYEEKTGETVNWSETAIIITSINEPNEAIRKFETGCIKNEGTLIVIGDRKSPDNFKLNHGRYITINEQLDSEFGLAKLLPENHYSRKNLGYLYAAEMGKSNFLDTDDDNIPLMDFWTKPVGKLSARTTKKTGWINSYKFFSNKLIWPRGFPIDKLQDEEELEYEKINDVNVSLLQGLAQHDPDVDAIFRLTNNKEVYFRKEKPLYLEQNQWCPINSQNTLWRGRELLPLLYLPSTCTIRETDILRGYVAQRILWTIEKGLIFHSADVLQSRNQHDLHQDFIQEEGLFRNSNKISKSFEELQLNEGTEYIITNMIKCYEVLADLNMVTKNELNLLDTWFEDVKKLT